MTLLLNGCSYGDAWTSFPGINLSLPGGSIARSIRTTIEWTVRNHKPQYVFIPLTFVSRFEISRIQEQNVPIEGSYIPADYDLVAQISDSCYWSWDYAFMNIILFSAWLEQQGINYLIWDQCNLFDKMHIRGFNGIEKLKLIENNPRVIPLFNFCGNQYMYENGGIPRTVVDEQQEPSIKHYTDESYPVLKEYLTKYIKDVLNEKVDW
jgi:hypothetical protein